uniref:NERD domain-containing protein n=1 Tax=Neobodo designis TaxID=312471 RepID=A0A7S1W1X5_NEODS|mmetsp:Transcript_49451/g.152625  ORF Transcript_49451/g.152625 Transcript_49451/m.152625 type:complete len:392 (+) Transcript_49451:36-1211(+)
MSGILNGLLSWSHRAALSYREVAQEKQRYHLALDAEDALGDVMQGLGHLADSIHLRKRIHVPEQGRSREIDVIAVTHCLYVVEVKNWAGKIWSNGNKWYQLPPRPGARALEFDDVLEECEYKARALVRTLMKHGVEMPAGSVRAIVVFANEKAQLDPATVGKHPSVFTREQFKDTVEPRSRTRDFLSYIAPSILASKSDIPVALRQKINGLLSKTRTWDTVVKHNGERYQGDLKWIKLVEYQDWRHVRDAQAGLNVQRQDIESVDLSWASPAWYGVLGAMWQGAAGVLTITVGKKYPMVAGDATAASAGGKGSGGAKKQPRESRRLDADPDAPRTHVVRLSTRSTHKNTIDVNHVVFQPAGQQGPSVFPLSEVATMELSANADRVGARPFQ